MSRNGVHGKSLGIFKSIYSQLKACVKVKGGLPTFFECNVGTRQGCVSSPIIFSLFINDLVAYLKQKCRSGIFISNDIEDLYALMFADDISSVAETVVKLQKQIDYIDEFCQETGMKLNLDKSKIMVFRNGGCLRRSEK